MSVLAKALAALAVAVVTCGLFYMVFGLLGYGDKILGVHIRVINRTGRDIFFYADIHPMRNYIEPLGQIPKNQESIIVVQDFNLDHNVLFDFGYNDVARARAQLSLNGRDVARHSRVTDRKVRLTFIAETEHLYLK
jgi:hypothetical protein